MFTVTRDRILSCFFFFNATSTTDIYTYLHTHSLHDALPISSRSAKKPGECRNGARDGGIVDIQMGDHADVRQVADRRSEEHTSELQSLMRISYAVFCLNKTTVTNTTNTWNILIETKSENTRTQINAQTPFSDQNDTNV